MDPASLPTRPPTGSEAPVALVAPPEASATVLALPSVSVMLQQTLAAHGMEEEQHKREVANLQAQIAKFQQLLPSSIPEDNPAQWSVVEGDDFGDGAILHSDVIFEGKEWQAESLSPKYGLQITQIVKNSNGDLRVTSEELGTTSCAKSASTFTFLSARSEVLEEKGGQQEKRVGSPEQSIFAMSESPSSARVKKEASKTWSEEKAQRKKDKKGSLQGLIKKKETASPLRRFLNGPFEHVSSIFIVLSTVILTMQLQRQGLNYGVALGVEESSGGWDALNLTFDIAEHIFNIFFAMELLIRIAVDRMTFFWHRDFEYFNILDCVIVFTTCLDCYIVAPVSQKPGMNLNFFRPFKFLRLFRAARIFRSVRVFIKLKLLVVTIANSLLAFFWSMVLLGIVMLMGAIFLCQALASNFASESITNERKLWIYRMYGTSAKAYYTLFEITFSGGWPNYARPLVEEVSGWYALFFFVYVSGVCFAMFRIITALFLRDSMMLATNDAELVVQEKMAQKKGYASKLHDFFAAADTSGDGLLSFTEFEAILEHPEVRAWLSVLELDVHETMELWSMLDDGTGYVNTDDFVSGVLRCKGWARAQDVLALMHRSKMMMRDIKELATVLDEMKVQMLENQSNTGVAGKLLLLGASTGDFGKHQ